MGGFFMEIAQLGCGSYDKLTAAHRKGFLIYVAAGFIPARAAYHDFVCR